MKNIFLEGRIMENHGLSLGLFCFSICFPLNPDTLEEKNLRGSHTAFCDLVISEAILTIASYLAQQNHCILKKMGNRAGEGYISLKDGGKKPICFNCIRRSVLQSHFVASSE